MAARKLCVQCKVEPKKPGHPKHCTECWLDHQDIATRSQARAARLAAVPEGLRRSRVPERDWPIGRRWCAGCQSFVRLVDCTGSRCRTCSSVANHGSRIKSTYVLNGRPFTTADYDALAARQHYLCAICGRRPKKRLTIDHDHVTGEVRGLVCGGTADDGAWSCNWSILASLDSLPDPLAAARRLVAYYEAPPAQRMIRAKDS